MSNILSTNDDEESLKAAFLHFNQVSDELIKAYHLLEIKAEKLATELQKANDELVSRSQTNAMLAQKLSTVLDAMPAAVIEVDADDVILSVNQSARRILPSTMIEGDKLEFSFVIESGKDGALKIATPENRDNPKFMTRQSCTLSNGHSLVLLFDISSTKHMSDQLAKKNKLAAMGEMTASLAHQLRTPLSTALLYAKNLEKDSLTADDRQKFTSKIVNRLKALESLVQNMLNFVRQDNPEAPKETLALSEVLSELEQVFQPQCDIRGLTLSISGSEETANYHIPKRILSILPNLIENAINHSASGGNIGVALHCTNDHLSAEVSDQGCGIPEHMIERVFEPFFTTRANGTGLGLSMAAVMTEELGGKLTYNRLDGVTTFSIVIPV